MWSRLELQQWRQESQLQQQSTLYSTYEYIVYEYDHNTRYVLCFTPLNGPLNRLFLSKDRKKPLPVIFCASFFPSIYAIYLYCAIQIYIITDKFLKIRVVDLVNIKWSAKSWKQIFEYVYAIACYILNKLKKIF